jgi:hypothetical protein
VRRLALLLLVGLALSGCGGGGGHKSSDSAQIRSAYVKFFSSKTNVADKVRLLEDGARFKALVASFANNPLAKNVSATVSSVTLEGKDRAKVAYSVKVAGAALPKQTGTAVRENGTWKVGNASLCKLVALGGTTPSACKS